MDSSTPRDKSSLMSAGVRVRVEAYVLPPGHPAAAGLLFCARCQGVPLYLTGPAAGNVSTECPICWNRHGRSIPMRPQPERMPT